MDIVKKLANANATNILVTADHGFLYQRTASSPPQFNLTVKPQGDADRGGEHAATYLVARLKEDDAFRKFQPEQLGLVERPGSTDSEFDPPDRQTRCRVSSSCTVVHRFRRSSCRLISINKGRYRHGRDGKCRDPPGDATRSPPARLW